MARRRQRMPATPILTRSDRRVTAYCLVAALCALSATTGAAAEPTLTAHLDTARITLGDPLRLRLVVDRDAEQKTLFPDLDDDQLAPFSVHSSMAATTTDLGQARRRDERVYELRAYTLEAGPVPAVDVAVVTERGDTLHLLSETLDVVVERVRDPEEGDELRGIKPPLHIPGGLPLWLVGILAALLAMGLAFLARRFLRRAPVETGAVAPARRGPVDYVREFARIADMGLLDRGATKLHYTRLADVMWRFLEDRIGIDALDRTTGEIAVDLGTADRVDAETTLRIVGFLEAADLVKFARAEPAVEVARRAPDDGAGIVGDVERLGRERAAARRRLAEQDATATIGVDSTDDEGGA